MIFKAKLLLQKLVNRILLTTVKDAGETKAKDTAKDARETKAKDTAKDARETKAKDTVKGWFG